MRHAPDHEKYDTEDDALFHSYVDHVDLNQYADGTEYVAEADKDFPAGDIERFKDALRGVAEERGGELVSRVQDERTLYFRIDGPASDTPADAGTDTADVAKPAGRRRAS